MLWIWDQAKWVIKVGGLKITPAAVYYLHDFYVVCS